MQHAKDYGLAAASSSADLEAVVKRSRGVAKQLNQGVTHLMKKNKTTAHMGEGTMTGPTSLPVKSAKGEEKLSAKPVLVAPGARARDMPFDPPHGKRVWTNRPPLTPTKKPTQTLSI